MKDRAEVQEEIARLKALVPTEKWRQKTQTTIDLMIEELERGVDRTAPEWEETDLEDQMAVIDAEIWKRHKSGSKKRPSDSFEGLVLPVKKGKRK